MHDCVSRLMHAGNYSSQCTEMHRFIEQSIPNQYRSTLLSRQSGILHMGTNVLKQTRGQRVLQIVNPTEVYPSHKREEVAGSLSGPGFRDAWCDRFSFTTRTPVVSRFRQGLPIRVLGEVIQTTCRRKLGFVEEGLSGGKQRSMRGISAFDQLASMSNAEMFGFVGYCLSWTTGP